LDETGHLAHGAPENPMTGEPEDTDVGYPGPEHHIAERELPMKLAMGLLALLALVGGVLQIPSVTKVLENFFEPDFAGSNFASITPSDSDAFIGLAVGAGMAVLGISLA